MTVETPSCLPPVPGHREGEPTGAQTPSPCSSGRWGRGGRGRGGAPGGGPGSGGGGGQAASAGSEAPSQGLPQGQRDSLAPGRECCPHTGKGTLTQPGRALRAVVPGSRPAAVGGAVGARGRAFIPACQERWATFPRSAADRPAGCPWPILLLPTPPAPGQAPAPSSPLPPRTPRPPKPWPGAQPGPGGQSYCKRPGRPEAWPLPAGHSCCRLPLPGSASRGRVLRPPSSRQATPVAEGGVPEKTPALPRACRRAQPESRPSAPSWATGPSHQATVGGVGRGRGGGGAPAGQAGCSFKPFPSEALVGVGWRWGATLTRVAISTKCQEVCLPASGLCVQPLELFIRPSTAQCRRGAPGALRNSSPSAAPDIKRDHCDQPTSP